MICIFYRNRSNFSNKINYNKEWIKKLKEKYIVKNNNYLEYKNLTHRYIEFYKQCHKQYNKCYIGILGISSGGYYAIKINNKINMDFCICISPIINPIFRKNYLLKKIEDNPELKHNIKYKNIIKINVTNIKKIIQFYINTLIILGGVDIQCPLDMFTPYNLNLS